MRVAAGIFILLCFVGHLSAQNQAALSERENLSLRIGTSPLSWLPELKSVHINSSIDWSNGHTIALDVAMLLGSEQFLTNRGFRLRLMYNHYIGKAGRTDFSVGAGLYYRNWNPRITASFTRLEGSFFQEITFTQYVDNWGVPLSAQFVREIGNRVIMEIQIGLMAYRDFNESQSVPYPDAVQVSRFLTERQLSEPYFGNIKIQYKIPLR